MVGLPHSALRALPGQLSVGQRQRVAVHVRFSEPSAVIADEGLLPHWTFCSRTDLRPAHRPQVLTGSLDDF